MAILSMIKLYSVFVHVIQLRLSNIPPSLGGRSLYRPVIDILSMIHDVYMA